MKNNFWGLIWSSFNEIQGVLLGLLGFLGGIALILIHSILLFL